MPGTGGIEATRTLASTPGGPVVFLCSTYAASDLPPAAAEAGTATPAG